MHPGPVAAALAAAGRMSGLGAARGPGGGLRAWAWC